MKDVNNYNVNKITKNPVTDFYLPDYVPTSVEEREKYYTIGSNVTAVTVNVEVQDGGLWTYGEGSGSDYMVEYEGGNTYYYPYTSITASHTDSGYGNKSDVFEIGANVAGVPRIFRFSIRINGTPRVDYKIYLRQEPTDVGDITISRFGGWGDVPAQGGQVLLKVESDSAWTANLDYNYTSLDRYSAQAGITNIVMTVEPNDSEQSRMCRVVATTVGGSSYTYQIEQSGQGAVPTNLDFHVSDTVFEPEGGSIAGWVVCPERDGSWAVTSCPAWLSVSPISGESGTTIIAVTAQANPVAESRFGEVTITAGVDTDSINFGQRANGTVFVGVEVTLDKYDFAGSGETVSGSVRASESWTLSTSGNWLVPSIVSGGTGTTAFTLEVLPNNTRYGRVGSITATGNSYMDEDSVTQDSQ